MIISVACHRLRLSTNITTEMDLANVSPGFNLLDAIKAELESYKDEYIGARTDDEEDKTGKRIAYRVHQESLILENFTLSGTFYRGEYGVIKSILDTSDSSKVFEQQLHHADETPLHFSISIKENAPYAFMMTQKDGIQGCITILKSIIKNAVKTHGNTLPLISYPVIPKYWISKYLKQSAKSIDIKLRTIDGDARSSLPNSEYLNHVDKTLNISAKRGYFLPFEAYKDWLNPTEGGVFSKDHPFEEVSIVFDLGDGKQRTWKVGDNSFSYPVIEQECESDATGFADFPSYRIMSLELSETLFEEHLEPEE